MEVYFVGYLQIMYSFYFFVFCPRSGTAQQVQKLVCNLNSREIVGLFPQQQELFSSPHCPDRLQTLTRLILYSAVSLALKRQGGEANQSSPSCNEVKNGWRCVSSLIRHNILHKRKFNPYLIHSTTTLTKIQVQ